MFTVTYKLNLNISQVGAESETIPPANIQPDCTTENHITHMNLINKSICMDQDYTMPLMEPKCGTVHISKTNFLQNPKFITTFPTAHSYPFCKPEKSILTLPLIHNLQKKLLGYLTQNECPDLRQLIQILPS